MAFDLEIHKRVSHILNNNSPSSLGLTNTSQNLFESGILDSVAILSLVIDLESEFEIDIPLEKIRPETFDSIDNIVDLILPLLKR